MYPMDGRAFGDVFGPGVFPPSCGDTIGPTGFPGPPGPEGPVGPRGAQGIAGLIGSKGPVGCQGLAGPMGAAGPQGPAGPAGAAGISGRQGDPGARGPVGPQGPQGSPGLQGSQGEPGPQGPDGSMGAAGPQGPQGEQGPQGPVGPAGDRGPAGPQGAVGNQGAQGIEGAAGERGATGPQGPQGAAGSGGQQGPTGTVGPTGDGYAPTYQEDLVMVSTNDPSKVDWLDKDAIKAACPCPNTVSSPSPPSPTDVSLNKVRIDPESEDGLDPDDCTTPVYQTLSGALADAAQRTAHISEPIAFDLSGSTHQISGDGINLTPSYKITGQEGTALKLSDGSSYGIKSAGSVEINGTTFDISKDSRVTLSDGFYQITKCRFISPAAYDPVLELRGAYAAFDGCSFGNGVRIDIGGNSTVLFKGCEFLSGGRSKAIIEASGGSSVKIVTPTGRAHQLFEIHDDSTVLWSNTPPEGSEGLRVDSMHEPNDKARLYYCGEK